MAITFVGAGTPYQGTASGITSIDVPYPTGVQVNDVLLMHLGSTSSTLVSTPSGWTLLEPNLAMGAGGPAAMAFYRVADASDTAQTVLTVTTPSAKYEAHMIALRGVAAALKDVASPTGGQSATTTMAVPPSVTTVTDGAWVLLFASALSGAGVTNSSWSSTNMTIRAQGTATHTTANPTGAVATFEVTPAGTFTPAISITPTPGRSSMRVVALRPASTALAVGTAAGTWTFSGAATGLKTSAFGTATGTWSYTGAAVGAAPISRVVSDWSSPATTSPQASGSATGSWSYTGVATGKRPPKATAVGTWLFTGVAVGLRPVYTTPVIGPFVATFATDGVNAAGFASDGVSAASFVTDGMNAAVFTSDGMGAASFG